MSGRTGDVRVRMQELQSIAGGRLFGAAVEGRLRPLSSHQYHLHHEAIKCPRCDSVNTKFCYYNNYNLSQPRHFCKSCRRYWTNGGVLRNVPVGGGCRKNKRSKAKQSPPEQPRAAAAPGEFHTAANSPPLKLPEQKSSSHSSSGSSNLTAAATEAVTGSTPVASFSSGGSFLNIREYESFIVPTTEEQEPNPDGACMRALLGHGAETGAFTDTGNFADLMTASAEPLPSGLEFSSMLLSQPSQDTCQQHQWPNHPDQSQTLGVGDLFHQTVQVDFSGMGSGSCGGGFGVSDWHVKDRGDFGLPTTVDQAYLSQGQSQWTDRDQGQYPETVPHINFSQFPF